MNIPLTKSQFAVVDQCDHDFIKSRGSWCYSKSGYAVHYSYDSQGKSRTLFMHRVIMERIFGQPIPAGFQVDHVSGGTEGSLARLDNRRENLRLATRSQNQANKGIDE